MPQSDTKTRPPGAKQLKVPSENAFHPGRNGAGELVPSRYAVKVGDIDVMVISDGVLPLPTSMLGHNIDPAVRADWMVNQFLPTDAFDWPLIYLKLPTGQVSWHIAPDDMDLFRHVPHGTARWDGHDTADKYARLDEFTRQLTETDPSGD